MEDMPHTNNHHTDPSKDVEDKAFSQNPSSNNTEGINREEVNQPDLATPLQQVADLQSQLATAQDKYVRLYAEFDNFRKRTAQEKASLIETASEKVLQALLPIVDDFERAIHALEQGNSSIGVEQGILSIHHKMLHLLEQTGVAAIPINKGSAFDPELHEAITKTPVTEKALQGKIVDIAEKGYQLKNKVLRYAKVIVGE